MRNDLLFIDGELVDLDDNTKITLNFKSNIFTDLSKIVSNNSYTIKLPKTVRNQRIIQHADLPACETDYPRNFHKARYFRNGVEIISRGKAVLISVGESFEMALTWGNSVAFNELVQDGKALNELPENEDYVQWDENLAISDYNAAVGFIISKINFGLKNDETLATYHPCVRVSYILDQIKSKYGLVLNWPENKKEFIPKLIIPLLTRNGGYANQKANYGTMEVASSQDGLLIWKNVEIGNNFNKVFEYSYAVGNVYVRFVKALVDGTIVFTPNLKSKNNDLVIFYGDTNIMENAVSIPYTEVDGEFPYYYNLPVEFDIQKDEYFTMGIKDGYATVSGNDTHQATFGLKPKEIQIGDRFPIIENLPKIKLIDFLKSICSLCGLFAVAKDNEDEITFVPVNSIRDNIPKAKNWTRKVVATYQENKPKEMAYALNDFARNNRMKWKEDNSIVGFYDGTIAVDDNTIDYERDAVTMPFSACDMRGGMASVPLYSYKTDGELNFSDVEPRILVEQNDSGKSKASFSGLDWATLIKDNYQSYQGLVRKPVILTEKIEVSDIDLKELDMTVPVYLGQYGRYYAIISIKAEDTGICECKLLQLEV